MSNFVGLGTRRRCLLAVRQWSYATKRLFGQVLIVVMMCALLLTVAMKARAIHRDISDTKKAHSPFSRLKVKPATLSFKRLDITTTPSENRSFTVSNTGTESLDVTVKPPSASEFNIASGGGAAVLAPSGKETLTVAFAPAASQKKRDAATISITSNAVSQ